MPRMSKKRKKEWALFLNDRNRITYKSFTENAGMTVSRVSAVLWCFARNIYRKGEQRKMIENEMTVSVPLEVVKASEIEPKEVKWLWYPYIPFGKVTLLQGDPGDGKAS